MSGAQELEAGGPSARIRDRIDLRIAKLAAVALAFVAVTIVTYLIARPHMFSGFANYDDEGYMLTALHSFLRHGSLYDKVFTQYGPFYYEFWGTIFSVFGIPVTHDGGRSVTLVVWVLCSLTFGLATARMTGSWLIGLATQVVVFSSLVTLVNEPMHPGGIIVLLLTCIVAISCAVRAKPSPIAMGALGGAVAALIMVKINVGGFALIALALVCAVTYAPLINRRWIRPALETVFVVLPFFLMTTKLDEAWGRQYAVHVAASALCVVLVLRARENRRRDPIELRWLIGGLVAVAAFSCVAVLGSGTSVHGLIDGVIRQPLRQADAFTIAFIMDKKAFLFDAVGLCGALGFWYVGRNRKGEGAWTGNAIAVASILIGLELALTPWGKTIPFDATMVGYPLSLLPFVWVALIPAPGDPRDATSFARLLLPPLAVFQGLHAFPVAGSQLLWSSFLMVPVGAICVANGIAGLQSGVSEQRERRALAMAGLAAALILLGFIANQGLRLPLRDEGNRYDALVSLNLPGAEKVHLEPSEVELYGNITRLINESCDSFVMLPGMDSFYVWTQQEPPTGLTATGWSTLFDGAHQRQAIAEIESDKNLCLLENGGLAVAWTGGRTPEGPLVDYMRREFHPYASVGDYNLLKKGGAGG